MSTGYMNIGPDFGSGSGGGVSSLNGQTGILTLLAGTNITVTPGVGTLTINSATTPGGSSGQIQYNNAGVLSGFGSTDGTNTTLNGTLSVLPSWNSTLASAIDVQINGQVGPSANLTNYTSLSIIPNFDPSAIIGTYNGLLINPSAFTATGEIDGLNIDLSNVTPGAGQQKYGLRINEGAINQFLTTTIQSGFFPVPLIGDLYGGVLQSVLGSPVTNTIVFDTLFLTSFLVQDDIAIDPLGWGISDLGIVGQVSASSGKTADTFNYMFAGGECLSNPGDGGTITNLSVFRSIGIFNGGGSLNITNLYNFKVDANTSSYATNAWGIYVADTNCNNWFAKNVVIGGVTGQPTGAFALDVTGTAKISGAVQLSNYGAGIATFDASGNITSVPAAQVVMVFTSSATVGGAATETLTVTGLLATDTIISVTQKTNGSGNLPLLAWSAQANNSIAGHWVGDPVVGAVLLVAVLR